MHRWMTLFWIAFSLPLAAREARAETPAAPAAVTAPAAHETAATPSTLTGDDERHKATVRAVGLPPELASRLTPEQLVELARENIQSRRSTVPGEWVPLAFFLAMVLGVLIVQLASIRRERDRQKTLQIMVEKGASIPPELLVPPQKVASPDADLRRGLVIGGTGLGVAGFFMAFHPSGMPEGLWSVGLIPLLIGLGYLAVWFVAKQRAAARG